MTIIPDGHVAIKMTADRDLVAAFDAIIDAHNGGYTRGRKRKGQITRAWLFRQFMNEFISEECHVLENDVRSRILKLIEERRGQ